MTCKTSTSLNRLHLLLMKRVIFILFATISCISHIHSAHHNDIICSSNTFENFNKEFSYESFSLGNITLQYRKAEIYLNYCDSTPLIIYLHGGSARGKDNTLQLNEKGIQDIYEYLSSRNIPSILIAPQCPPNEGWTNQNRKVIYELAKDFIQRGVIDANRIYILGGSMGGTGTWCQLSHFPNFYAGAMPVAGNPNGMNTENIASTPVLTVMGSADNIMNLEAVELLQQEVISLGGTLILDIEEGWTHANTCEQSYTNERLDWLFSKKLNELTKIQYTKGTSTPFRDTYHDMSGRPTDTPYKGIYIKKRNKYIVNKK